MWRRKSILIQEMIENVDDAYIKDSDDDLNEWQSEAMNNDEELQNIMDFYLVLIPTKMIKINKHTHDTFNVSKYILNSL